MGGYWVLSIEIEVSCSGTQHAQIEHQIAFNMQSLVRNIEKERLHDKPKEPLMERADHTNGGFSAVTIMNG